ncbi:MAG: hypothetical protein Tp118SUR00d2C21406231_43 [Prokaryotic dsDNA virus sp.]|nr:MAG: hypothetical protein Tp125DCM00d2C40298531_62 [Prokaryotic dsDNA virus sp.]QDP53163.1 MAG: hypothetical protein Tp118SUR00d2C21406231_43 [Prokaryotic dsDNA virus sp.]|tara:strand:- start:25730 stop:26104 length:375 start_codon:yes stop_codon:yes gene_type:complete
MKLIDDVKSDVNLAATRKKSAAKWSVGLDEIPGIIYISGPAQKLTIVTTATNLNGEDFVARHADARRIARVPDLEAALLAADELAAAIDQERNMVCQDFDAQAKSAAAVDEALAAYRKATGETK